MNIQDENDIRKEFNFDEFVTEYNELTRNYLIKATRDDYTVGVIIGENCTVGTHTSTSYDEDGTTETHTFTVTPEQFMKTLKRACRGLQSAIDYKEKSK